MTIITILKSLYMNHNRTPETSELLTCSYYTCTAKNTGATSVLQLGYLQKCLSGDTGAKKMALDYKGAKRRLLILKGANLVFHGSGRPADWVGSGQHFFLNYDGSRRVENSTKLIYYI